MKIVCPIQSKRLEIDYSGKELTLTIIDTTSEDMQMSIWLEDTEVAGVVGCLNEFLRKK